MLSACTASPTDVLDHAFRAFEHGDIALLSALTDDGYVDPLGGKKALLDDVEALSRIPGRISIRPSDISISVGASKIDATVVGRLDLELPARSTWRVTGPLEVDLRRTDGFRIRSGFLSDFRDIERLMRLRKAALEANDATGYGKLLHPAYKDGDQDLEQIRARLAEDLTGVRIRVEPSLYKLEVRGPIAHLDEHYILTVNDKVLPAAIARLTLRRQAGLWRIASGLYPAP